MTFRACPVCAFRKFRPRLRREEIGKEIKIRNRFVNRRLDHKPEPAELMDLTQFMHGNPDRLVSCLGCGLTVRDESHEAVYATDLYDRDLLDHLYPRYLHAFQQKELHYRYLLPPKGEVIEVGSHLGAFLETAEEWNWHPTGFDVGADTSAFAARRGLRLKRSALEDANIRQRSMDAVFIWNCFEQLHDPSPTLLAARAVLKPRGLFVVRTPNFAFYERYRRLAAVPWLRESAIRALAYNNLLGFPYLLGYTPLALSALLRRYGFDPIAGFDSTLLTMPFPNLTENLREEAANVRGPRNDSGPVNPSALCGPWMEIICRRSR